MPAPRHTIPRRIPRGTRALAASLLSGCLLLSGCVVVEDTGKKRPSASSAGNQSKNQGKPTALNGTKSGSGATLPTGPVARPAEGARVTSSRVLVNVAPIGVVRYDGQCLPITSPDGRFLAAQDGDPPSWPTLLAEPSATPAATSRLAAYDLSTSPATLLDWPTAPPEGLVLGRAADDSGVLVELPHEDGSRWIGKLMWLSGEVRWLVQTSDVNAHATWTADGRLLFTRRHPEEPSNRSRLVLLSPDGSEATRSALNGGYSFPMATSDTSVVYALVLTPTGTELEAIRVLADTPSSPATLGGSLARRILTTAVGPAIAYQIAAPVQPPLPLRRDTTAAASPPEPPRADPLIIFHPQFGRTAIFDIRRASFGLLAPKSMAAIRAPSSAGDGFFCAAPEGLVFTPFPSTDPKSTDRRFPDVRVLAGMYAPRATTDPARPFLLLAPAPRDPTSVQVMGMTLAASAE
jgi:hypothetical protein